MLPDFNIPTLTALLTAFRPCFTAPGYRTFAALVVGLIAQTRRRTVCGMLLGAGLAGVWHHSKAHRFFAAARWCADEVGLALADTIVAVLLDPEAPLVVVVDDTLFKRTGKKVFGTAWHHDGAAKGPKPIGFGNCWVVAGLVVTLPFLSRPVCLPVLCRLWRPRRTGKLAYARELAQLLATRHPNRTVHVVGDAAYVGEHLRGLPPQITWTSRLKVTSVLHELATPAHGKVRPAPHQGSTDRHPGRPRQDSRLADHQGPPLRTRRHRGPRRCHVPLVRALPFPAGAGDPGPRRQAPHQEQGRPRLRTAAGHHRPRLNTRRTHRPLRIPLVHRGAPLLVRPNRVCFLMVPFRSLGGCAGLRSSGLGCSSHVGGRGVRLGVRVPRGRPG